MSSTDTSTVGQLSIRMERIERNLNANTVGLELTVCNVPVKKEQRLSLGVMAYNFVSSLLDLNSKDFQLRDVIRATPAGKNKFDDTLLNIRIELPVIIYDMVLSKYRTGSDAMRQYNATRRPNVRFYLQSCQTYEQRQERSRAVYVAAEIKKKHADIRTTVGNDGKIRLNNSGWLHFAVIADQHAIDLSHFSNHSNAVPTHSVLSSVPGTSFVSDTTNVASNGSNILKRSASNEIGNLSKRSTPDQIVGDTNAQSSVVSNPG